MGGAAPQLRQMQEKVLLGTVVRCEQKRAVVLQDGSRRSQVPAQASCDPPLVSAPQLPSSSLRVWAMMLGLRLPVRW